MLKTGEWLVPHIGAHPYLRKPPLLNWLIALSFRANGGASEFAARLPSVLAMLALALTVVCAGQQWLGVLGALQAAMFVLTNLAAMETGRLAELEALYVSLTGIALLLWLTGWRFQANPWRLWGASAPFLALGMLTKGPAHLIFFYGVVGAVLVVGKEWRLLWHPAHLVALALTVGPFLAWAIPCAAAVGTADQLRGAGGAWGFWWREISSRAALPEAGHFGLGEWLLRVPRGGVNFLPWTVLLPLLWTPGVLARLAKAAGPREVALFRGARWGMSVTFLVMSLLPASSARYLYPLIIVPSLLLARVLTIPANGDDPQNALTGLATAWRLTNQIIYALIIGAAALMPFCTVAGASRGAAIVGGGVIILLSVFIGRWPQRRRAHWFQLTLQSAAGMVLLTTIYAIAAVPRLNRRREGLPREVAAAIRAHVPAGQELGILDQGYQAFWYYLEPSVVYFRRPEDVALDDDLKYFVLPAASVEAVRQEAARQHVTLSPLAETSDLEHHGFVLVARQSAEVPPPPAAFP